MAFPTEAFLQARKYQVAQANQPNQNIEGMGQVAGSLLSTAITQDTELKKRRADAIGNFVKTNMFFDAQNQRQLNADEIMGLHDQFVNTGKLPENIQVKSMRAKEDEDFAAKLDRIEKEAAARARGGITGGMGGTSVDTKVFEQENKLRDDFRKDIGDFVKQRDAYSRVSASAKDPTAAGDLSLIYAYMKMLDPASVVRESEFAQAASAGSYGERIKAAVKKVSTGERLSADVRKDFVDRSNRLYEKAQENYKNIKGDYTKRAKSYGLDPNRILTEFEAGNTVIVQRETTTRKDPLGLGIK